MGAIWPWPISTLHHPWEEAYFLLRCFCWFNIVQLLSTKEKRIRKGSNSTTPNNNHRKSLLIVQGDGRIRRFKNRHTTLAPGHTQRRRKNDGDMGSRQGYSRIELIGSIRMKGSSNCRMKRQEVGRRAIRGEGGREEAGERKTGSQGSPAEGSE